MYLVLKLIHVAAAVMFLGNITTGIFWKSFADATKDPKVIAHTLGGIIKADRVFTIPSIIVLVAAGIATAVVGQYPMLHTGWILWSIVLFILAGIAFGPISRRQREMYAAASAGAATGQVDWSLYERLSASWNFWGFIALAAPLLAMALMILKPPLPAFPV